MHKKPPPVLVSEGTLRGCLEFVFALLIVGGRLIAGLLLDASVRSLYVAIRIFCVPCRC